MGFREERLEAARRLEEWKLEKRSREELEEKARLAEEVHQRRRAKVGLSLSFEWKEARGLSCFFFCFLVSFSEEEVTHVFDIHNTKYKTQHTRKQLVIRHYY